MKYVLNEGVSDIVYHFTTMKALSNILKTNTIKFSTAQTATDKRLQPEGYPYYLSLTRQSSPNVGYAKMKNRPLRVNEGEYKRPKTSQLQNFEIKPLIRRKNIVSVDKNAADDNLSPKQQYSKRVQNLVTPTYKVKNDDGTLTYILDKNQEYNRNKISQYSESEDRIFSKTKYFENVFDYIIRIDVFASGRNLRVRICFDGQKLKSKFLCAPVDFIFNKYANTLKKSVLAEKKVLNQNDWDILKICLQDIKTKILNGNNSYKEKIINWLPKVFLHLNSQTVNLGANLLQKHKFDNVVGGKDLQNMIKGNVQMKRGRKKNELPNLPESLLDSILKIIFALSPTFKNSIPKKVKYCSKLCKEYFNGITISYHGKTMPLEKVLINKLTQGGEFIEKWLSFNNNPKSFMSIQKDINNINKKFNGDLNAIGDQLLLFIFNYIKRTGLNIGNVIYQTWLSNNKTPKRTEQKIKISEDEIKEMVLEVLEKI